MMAAPVSIESGFAAGTPVVISGAGSFDSLAATGALFVDASPDGRALLLARPVGDSSARAPVNVLINWTSDRSRRGSTGRTTSRGTQRRARLAWLSAGACSC
jgi:hypothetical protein